MSNHILNWLLRDMESYFAKLVSCTQANSHKLQEGAMAQWQSYRKHKQGVPDSIPGSISGSKSLGRYCTIKVLIDGSMCVCVNYNQQNREMCKYSKTCKPEKHTGKGVFGIGSNRLIVLSQLISYTGAKKSRTQSYTTFSADAAVQDVHCVFPLLSQGCISAAFV